MKSEEGYRRGYETKVLTETGAWYDSTNSAVIVRYGEILPSYAGMIELSSEHQCLLTGGKGLPL